MKIASILFRVLAILAAGGAVAIGLLTQGKVKEANDTLTSERRKNVQAVNNLTESLEQAKLEKDQAVSAADQATRKASAVQSQMESAVSQLRSQVSAADAAKTEAEQAVQGLKDKVAELERQLETERSKKPEVDPAEYEAAKSRVTALESQVTTLKAKIADLERAKSAVAAVPALGGAKPAVAPVAPVASKGAVKEPEVVSGESSVSVLGYHAQIGAVVLDISKASGISEGSTIALTRDGKQVARIRVTRVINGQCVGSVVPGQGSVSLLRQGEKFTVNTL